MKNRSQNSSRNTEDKVDYKNKTSQSSSKGFDNVIYKKRKKIISIIEYVIIAIIIFVNAVWIYESTVNPNKAPSMFGKKAFVVVSGSMVPEIQIGDIAIFNNSANADVEDIIAFRRGSDVIVHRIVKKVDIGKKILYQTKGDSNSAEDEGLVETSDIEGVYETKIPFVGLIMMWLYDNLAIVVIVLILVIIIKYYFIK